MSDENLNVNGDAENEAALDAALAADLAAVKAGQTLEAAPQSQTGETVPTGPTGEAPTGEIGPTGDTGSTGEAATGEASATGATGEVEELRLPNKGKYESDEAYEKRVELFDLVRRRKAAETPETKAAISEQIKTTKGELKALGGAEKFINPSADTGSTGATGSTGEADPVLKADQDRLRALGGATKEDVAAYVAQERHETEMRANVQNFVGNHAELKDEDVREVFFDWVDQNYNWQDKSGRALSGVLEMAYDSYFKPTESVQERVLRAAGVAEKVGAMNFPGGTGNGTGSGLSPEMRASVKELTDTGMPEDKAIELLSDL